MSTKLYLEEVREQYEAYPYPPREPDDEARRLICPISGSLLAINHHCFGGKRDFRSGFRCLVAGGGTGDSTIYLAEQLRRYDAEVVYLDMSRASRQVAEDRARVRDLGNISFVTASIMELPRLGLGQFDYIECGGVLHHLESTEAGLQALNAVLKDDGAIFLMLYGRYGRRAVYDMQTLLREYLPPELDMQGKVAGARRLLDALPESNSFVRNIEPFASEIAAGGAGDAGLYDLLLHSQDRCFEVAELYQLAHSAGLHLLSFAVNADAYDPRSHVADGAVRRHIAAMDKPRRQALAERLVGNIRKHEFFLARQPDRGASLRDDSRALRSYGSLLVNASRLAADMVPAPGRTMRYADSFYTLQIECTPVAKLIFGNMNGSTSLRALRRRACRTLPGVTAKAFDHELRRIFDQLHPRGYLYLLSAGTYGIHLPDYTKLRSSRAEAEQPASEGPGL